MAQAALQSLLRVWVFAWGLGFKGWGLGLRAEG